MSEPEANGSESAGGFDLVDDRGGEVAAMGGHMAGQRRAVDERGGPSSCRRLGRASAGAGPAGRAPRRRLGSWSSILHENDRWRDPGPFFSAGFVPVVDLKGKGGLPAASKMLARTGSEPRIRRFDLHQSVTDCFRPDGWRMGDLGVPNEMTPRAGGRSVGAS